MEESLFAFAYSVSFLDPESSLRRPPTRCGKRAEATYFPGSPGSETGLWSPNIPEVLGTSGTEACRPEGKPEGCCWSAESWSGRVSVGTGTEDASLDLFRADSGLCGDGGERLVHS